MSGTGESGDDVDDEAVAEAESAFGESTCGSATMDADSVEELFCGDTGAAFASPNGAYNHASCTNSWIVGFDGWAEGTLRASVKWAGAIPNNQTDCENSRVEGKAYTASGGLLDTTTRSGLWVLGTCLINHSFGNAPLYAADGGQVISQAYTLGIFGVKNYKPVSVTYSVDPC